MKEHIKILDFLRGIAALGVVLFHFGNGAIPSVNHSCLSKFFSFGENGVQVFFVISGFIIPFSLYKVNYTIKNYFRNIARRFVRIDPPSYCSMLLTILFYYSAVVILGRPMAGINYWPGLQLIPVISNLTYTADYAGAVWYNPVFWTLAIEFQFYLLIGLMLPVLVKKNNTVIFFVLLAFLGLSYVPVKSIFTYGSFFVLGILLFLAREKLIHRNVLVALLVLASVFCFLKRGLVELLAAGIAVVSIRFLKFSNPVTNHLGKISYSLYLTHEMAGPAAEIIFKRITPVHLAEPLKLLMLFIYVLISIGFATLFYYTIERYFQKLSKRILFKS